MNRIALQNVLLGVIVSFSLACEVSEDSLPAVVDSSGNEVSEVNEADILANDSINFRTLLSDTTSKTWDASFFTLLGMEQPCRFDDVIVFIEDGTYQYSSGPNLCGAEDNQSSRTGTWEINYSTETIVFDKGSSDEYTADVIGLSEDELRLKGTYMGMEVRGLYSTK